MPLNLATILKESARAGGDRVAIYSGGRPTTYRELDERSDRVAAALRREGVRPGDPVALQLPNVPEFVVAYFGILKNGSVVVPLNILLKAPEIAYHLADSGAVALITWSPVVDEAGKGAADAGLRHIFEVAGSRLGRPFDELLQPVEPGTAPFEPTDPGAPAALVYTSGTTGRPKGAELTHFQMYMNADTPGRLFGVRPDDVVLVALPLFHVFGLCSELNVCTRFGCAMSLVPRFEPTAVLEAIQRDRITIFEGVPTMYIALLNAPDLDRFDISSLRVGISGGAPMPAEVLDEVERRFGIVVLEGYGMTETASTITFNVSAADRKIYSIGKPIWGVEVAVWDDDGRPRPPGRDHVGELVVRGVNTMRGYHGQPEATATAFDGGWFHTGDLGFLDEDGFFFIVDRKKELIIRGGYNVYPREVEEVLYGHPAVAEVAVIGVPHPLLGEEVKAFVELKPGADATEDEIVAYAKERLAAYKYPRSVEIRPSLPKIATGKIDKVALRSER